MTARSELEQAKPRHDIAPGAVSDLAPSRGSAPDHVGDVTVKRRLEDILQALIAPIRTRRAELATNRDHAVDVIRRGTSKAREITERTKRDVMEGLGLFQL